MEPYIVGIRFQTVGKIYHFNANCCQDIAVGDHAVVETSRGLQIGEIAAIIDGGESPRDGQWKSILRKATPRDLVLRQVWERKEVEATINCRAKLKDLKISGVKIVSSEYTLDGMRLTFLYSSESDNGVDLNPLRKAMNKVYRQPKIDLRQIGPRDAAKLIGGMGACGMENRCCSKFLTEFSPISIRMAKAQGVSLAPSEITGMCGRLRCCLIYEYEQYVEARKKLPKKGKRVDTEFGQGKVVDSYPLKDTVVVDLGETGYKELSRTDIEPWDEKEALRRKAEQQCDSENCDCGKKTQKDES